MVVEQTSRVPDVTLEKVPGAAHNGAARRRSATEGSVAADASEVIRMKPQLGRPADHTGVRNERSGGDDRSGGSGADEIQGQSGNDRLFGGGTTLPVSRASQATSGGGGPDDYAARARSYVARMFCAQVHDAGTLDRLRAAMWEVSRRP